MTNNKSRTAIILCGGRGSRLGAISKKIPKTLVKIQGKEILWYIIKFLKKNKFNHFILPLGYKSKMIKNFIYKNNGFDSKIDLVNTGVNTNISKRIFNVISKIKSENILLLNGDTIFNFDINKIFLQHEKSKLDATFLSVETTYQFGTVCMKNNKIVNFKRNIVFDSVNIRSNKKIIAYNYAGIIFIKKKNLIKYKKIFYNCENFEKDFYPMLIKKYSTNMVKINGFFYSVDNVKDINIANNKKTVEFKNIILVKNKIKKIK